MTTEILSPLDFGGTTQVAGRMFRKQLLPQGSITYEGRKLDFTRRMLADIEAAFRAGAHDTVPLVMADGKNTHTMSPTAVTGEVVDLELTDDGLDAIIRADGDTAALLTSHPKIGISARIKQDYERSDGTTFPACLQHALITTDPRITGMRPWEAVDLANEQADDLIDLSLYTFVADSGDDPTKEESVMADTPEPLTADEIAEMRTLLSAVRAAEAPEDEPEPYTDADLVPDGDEDELDFTDEEIERLANEALAEVEEPEPIAASDNSEALELANARTSELEVQLANMQASLDAREFEAEKSRLIAECGIPPVVVDLARPLLEGSRTVELANGDSVDAGKIVRDMFTALSELNLVDLSQAKGHAFETDATRSEAEDRTAWVNGARTELGI